MELKEGFAVRKRAKTEGMLTDKQVSSFGSAQVKPEARFVEEFLEEPTLFAPKPEFLVSTYIEVKNPLVLPLFYHTFVLLG